MKNYRVAWTIEVEAPTERAAAELALRIQRDKQSIATVFEVTAVDSEGYTCNAATQGCPVQVDLSVAPWECEEEEKEPKQSERDARWKADQDACEARSEEKEAR